jgi:hypothetical protein
MCLHRFGSLMVAICVHVAKPLASSCCPTCFSRSCNPRSKRSHSYPRKIAYGHDRTSCKKYVNRGSLPRMGPTAFADTPYPRTYHVMIASACKQPTGEGGGDRADYFRIFSTTWRPFAGKIQVK